MVRLYPLKINRADFDNEISPIYFKRIFVFRFLFPFGMSMRAYICKEYHGGETPQAPEAYS